MRWYNRQSQTWGYHIAIMVWLSAAYWALMVIPYQYDQQNKQQYEEAVAQGRLVIREFIGLYQARILDQCKTDTLAPCTEANLFKILKDKRLIALDYISNLQAAGRLSSWEFWKVCMLVYIVMLILTGAVSRLTVNHNLRFLLLLSIMILGILAVHLVVDLPHKNVKFYYIMGSIFSLVFPLMDYFHNVPTIGTHRKLGEGRHLALQNIHARWTSILNISLAIVITVLGTISFNIVDYHKNIFGESFMYYPLIGVVVVLVIALGGYFWGILRNLVYILSELEVEMSYVWERGHPPRVEHEQQVA